MHAVSNDATMTMLEEVSQCLNLIPNQLKVELLDSYINIQQNYIEQRWEPSELNGGKFCEVTYMIVLGLLSGHFDLNAKRPRNLFDACRKLEQDFPKGQRSLRIQIPRAIIALYEVRNNRGVVHSGTEVNPNHMDAAFVLNISKWILAELIRVVSNTTPVISMNIIERITIKTEPIIWKSAEGVKRVLNNKLTYKQQAILLLYDSRTISARDLCSYIECNNFGNFNRDVLKPLHKERLIEYNTETELCTLLPPGDSFAQDLLLDNLGNYS